MSVELKHSKQRPLVWYFRRLQSMPFAEIPHRVTEVFLRQLGRLSLVARRDAKLPLGLSTQTLPILPLALHKLQSSISEHDATRLAQDVDRLCGQPLELLGRKWPPNTSTDWALDPDSLKHWSWRQYTFDIPRRSGQGPGDVKLVWELSRLQHLQVLALGALVLDRVDARTQCVQQLEAWLDDNPPYQGLAYASGIELASRVVSILFIVGCLGQDSLPEPLARKIWQALLVHGKWLARFPSLYSSANNHLVAESVALFVLGSVAPQLPAAKNWQSIGWERLVDLADELVLEDGAGAEQSPTYLAYTMEWFLLARVVRTASLDIVATDIDAALTRGARFISCISDVGGRVPFIGDCDNGLVLKPGLTEENYPASIVAAIAAVLQCGAAVHPAFTADLRTRLFTTKAIPESLLDLGSKVFESGGYTVLRSGDSDRDRELFVMFDHGLLGFAPMAGHGHADALAVWLHVDGQPVFVDFGTYRYNADAGWRDWARGTAAHNTIEVDGQSQSDITGPFNWGRQAAGELIEHNVGENAQFVRASHGGYVETSGVTHTRQIESIGATDLAISDDLSGSGRHAVKLCFHLASELEIETLAVGEFALYLGGKLIINMTIDCPGLSCESIRQQGNKRPGDGVISPSYNVLLAANTISAVGEVELPYTCRTTLRIIR